MPVPTFRLTFDRFVSRDGYAWFVGTPVNLDTFESGPTRYLVDLASPTDGRRQRYSKPLVERTGLFRDFAEVRVNEEDIKAFADLNGNLGTGDAVLLEGKSSTCRGESFGLWRREILAMRHCVELVDAVQAGDNETLSKRIIWRGDRVDYRSVPDWKPGQPLDPEEGATFANILTPSNAYALEKIQRGDLVRPALSHVQIEINHRLTDHTRLRMFWNDDLTEMQNLATPKNMLGAMWLQFAMSIQSKSAFKRCAHCNRWFELTPKVARSDKVYCTSVCRVKAYRLRKAGGEEGAEQHDGQADEAPGRIFDD